MAELGVLVAPATFVSASRQPIRLQAIGVEHACPACRNIRAKLWWRCSVGHEWEATLNSVKNVGSWCPHCAGTSPHSLAMAHQLAAVHEGECLSREYKNVHDNLIWRCLAGHTWEMSLGSVKHKGSWCSKCAASERQTYTLRQACKTAVQRGGLCLSTVFAQKLRWQCAEGHVWEAMWANVRAGSWCPTCYYSSRRLGLRSAQDIASEHGGQCLSLEYQGVRCNLRWQCAEGHEWEAPLARVKHEKCWCPLCSKDSRESRVRQIMERIFPGHLFPRRRPSFLRGPLGWPLELDGFNEKLQVAFEYNGEQHYDSYHYWNRSRTNYHTPIDVADQLKVRLAGVRLIIVPYWVVDLLTFVRLSLLRWFAVSDVNPILIANSH